MRFVIFVEHAFTFQASPAMLSFPSDRSPARWFKKQEALWGAMAQCAAIANKLDGNGPQFAAFTWDDVCDSIVYM